MKKLIALIALLIGLGGVQVATADTQFATLSGKAPIENTDGSPITDFAGVRVYYGTAPGSYTEPTIDFPLPPPTGGTLFSFDITHEIPAGATVTYYYTVTAYTLSGIESAFATMGSKTFFGPDLIPNSVTDFAVDGATVIVGDAPSP